MSSPSEAQNFKELFRQNLKSYRRRRNFSLEELAEKSDCQTGYLRKVEHGSVDPSLDSVKQISRALNIEPRDLWSTHG